MPVFRVLVLPRIWQKAARKDRLKLLSAAKALAAHGICLSIQASVLTLTCQRLALILSHGKKPVFWRMVPRLKAIWQKF